MILHCTQHVSSAIFTAVKVYILDDLCLFGLIIMYVYCASIIELTLRTAVHSEPVSVPTVHNGLDQSIWSVHCVWSVLNHCLLYTRSTDYCNYSAHCTCTGHWMCSLPVRIAMLRALHYTMHVNFAQVSTPTLFIATVLYPWNWTYIFSAIFAREGTDDVHCMCIEHWCVHIQYKLQIQFTSCTPAW